MKNLTRRKSNLEQACDNMETILNFADAVKEANKKPYNPRKEAMEEYHKMSGRIPLVCLGMTILILLLSSCAVRPAYIEVEWVEDEVLYEVPPYGDN